MDPETGRLRLGFADSGKQVNGRPAWFAKLKGGVPNIPSASTPAAAPQAAQEGGDDIPF